MGAGLAVTESGKEKLSQVRQLTRPENGIDSPYCLELLASIHYLKHIAYVPEAKRITRENVGQKLQDLGKVRFGEEQVQTAWLALDNAAEGDVADSSRQDSEAKRFLDDMANVGSMPSVDHEHLGKGILLRRNDLSKTLKTNGFDPEEIGKIFSGEHEDNLLYSQLIHSTLDGDRVDFLLRDSYHTGVSYGHVDLDFILSNLKYHNDEGLIAVDYKGIPSFEHYLLGRYYMYHVYLHRTVVGFELMAKTLYYWMAREGRVVADFDDIVKQIDSDWLEDFYDNYFRRSLREWTPVAGEHTEDHREYLLDLKDHLLKRRPLKLLYEERCFPQRSNRAEGGGDFRYLRQDVLDDSVKLENLLKEYNILPDCVAVVPCKIEIEAHSPLTGHKDALPDTQERELGKVYEGYSVKDLIEVEYSPISKLSLFIQRIRRLFFFDRDDHNINREEFAKRLREVLTGC